VATAAAVPVAEGVDVILSIQIAQHLEAEIAKKFAVTSLIPPSAGIASLEITLVHQVTHPLLAKFPRRNPPQQILQ
jgi:hypothetical protein